MSENKKVSYSGVVLTDFSRQLLLSYIDSKDLILDGWEVIAHHMTINMGPLPEEKRHLIGKRVELNVIAIGQSKSVIAVQVEDNGLSTNDIPHITVAIDRDAGAKPFHSNFIQNWEPIKDPFTVEGIVQEV